MVHFLLRKHYSADLLLQDGVTCGICFDQLEVEGYYCCFSPSFLRVWDGPYSNSHLTSIMGFHFFKDELFECWAISSNKIVVELEHTSSFHFPFSDLRENMHLHIDIFTKLCGTPKLWWMFFHTRQVNLCELTLSKDVLFYYSCYNFHLWFYSSLLVLHPTNCCSKHLSWVRDP